MSLRDLGKQLRDLRGNMFNRSRPSDRRVTHANDTEQAAEDAEELERRILHAANLSATVRKNAGAGWFPGDPL